MGAEFERSRKPKDRIANFSRAWFVILMMFAFGGIHFISWGADFRSPVDKYLWRSSSIAITTFPAGIVYVTVLARGSPWPGKSVRGRQVFTAGISLYAVVRIIPLVVCVRAFAYLPVEAYRTVSWTNFLPHV